MTPADIDINAAPASALEVDYAGAADAGPLTAAAPRVLAAATAFLQQAGASSRIAAASGGGRDNYTSCGGCDVEGSFMIVACLVGFLAIAAAFSFVLLRLEPAKKVPAAADPAFESSYATLSSTTSDLTSRGFERYERHHVPGQTFAKNFRSEWETTMLRSSPGENMIPSMDSGTNADDRNMLYSAKQAAPMKSLSPNTMLYSSSDEERMGAGAGAMKSQFSEQDEDDTLTSEAPPEAPGFFASLFGGAPTVASSKASKRPGNSSVTQKQNASAKPSSGSIKASKRSLQQVGDRNGSAGVVSFAGSPTGSSSMNASPMNAASMHKSAKKSTNKSAHKSGAVPPMDGDEVDLVSRVPDIQSGAASKYALQSTTSSDYTFTPQKSGATVNYKSGSTDGGASMGLR